MPGSIVPENQRPYTRRSSRATEENHPSQAAWSPQPAAKACFYYGTACRRGVLGLHDYWKHVAKLASISTAQQLLMPGSMLPPSSFVM